MIEKYVVSLDVEKRELKEYLIEQFEFSSRRIKMLLKNKKILINGKYAYWDSKIKDKDILYMNLADRINDEIKAQQIPLNIIYEDEYMLVMNKPPFMLVHPTMNHMEGTLANGVKSYFERTMQNIAIRFLNRLDMNTSGIIVLPKDSKTHSCLNEMMSKNLIIKTYMAVVEGEVCPKKGTIEMPIAKDEKDKIKRIVSSNGQTAITEYSVIEYLKDASVVELRLITGRTHQIRVHLSHIGYPITGDSLYGSQSNLINRQALHACSMQLEHPKTKEVLILKAPIPTDISDLINGLKK